MIVDYESHTVNLTPHATQFFLEPLAIGALFTDVFCVYILHSVVQYARYRTVVRKPTIENSYTQYRIDTNTIS